MTIHSLMYVYSWYAEHLAGFFGGRLKSKKNPAFSIMSDWQRHEFLGRQRALHPEMFLEDDKKQAKFDHLRLRHPVYLSDSGEVELKASEVIVHNVHLSPDATEELTSFLEDNQIRLAPGEERKKQVVYYRGLELNSIKIRTAASEAGIKTRDSIVCGRYYVYDADGDDDDWGEERLIFGSVQHILKYGSETLVYADWFQKTCSRFTDDHREGLCVIPVRKRNRRIQRDKINGWMQVDHLLMQRHMLVGDVTDSEFYIVIKI